LEIQLTEIWEEVLGVHPVSVNDNFFDLGGHSLLAVRLFAMLEEAFGKSLPVATLFQSPTVAQLANVLRKEGWLTTSSLVAIQAEGSRPPLYCVHGMGGGVLDYIDLAYHLGSDQPFYGLQERGFDDVHEPFTSIQAMAEHYIREIQTFQPKGPYYLGGYCYGGTVAFEMARQLHQQGQRVALLAIIDNTAPNLGYYSALWKPGNMYRFLKNIPNWLRDFQQLSPPDMIDRIARKMRILAKDVKNISLSSSDVDTSPSQADLEAIIDVDLDSIPKKYHKFLRAHYLALRNYTPQPYAGQITLFRTQRYPLLGPFDPQMGWGNLADKGVEVKEITGFHAFILQTPYVQQLARQLRLSLANAKK
jgi:thioesterase domain-containing protein/acyl carrier protein